jgi:hypothetical protein
LLNPVKHYEPLPQKPLNILKPKYYDPREPLEPLEPLPTQLIFQKPPPTQLVFQEPKEPKYNWNILLNKLNIDMLQKLFDETHKEIKKRKYDQNKSYDDVDKFLNSLT